MNVRITWLPCWRIIPSRFPPIDLFERVTDPADLEAVIALETMTNPRILDQVGQIRLVPVEDRVSGPGSSAIMAAFTHLSPSGSRFTDGTYGVFYAAGNLNTAIAETKHSRAGFMAATQQGRTDLDMRVYVTDLDGDLHDIRGQMEELPAVYEANNYSAGQALARELREAGEYGLVYDSVRLRGGQCVAIFRPPVLSNARQERHLCYVWDGHEISDVYEKRALNR